MAIVVMFGAGASFGSGDVAPDNPPLGNQLFDRLAKVNGSVAASLSDDLKEAFRQNFEDGMAKYSEKTAGDVMAFQRELAMLLAQYKPGNNNCYRTIIKARRRKDVIYTTLNYDLLFELSARDLGLAIHYDSNLRMHSIRLLKIHGSCNFWPDESLFKLDNVKIFGAWMAEVEAPVRPLDQFQTIERCEKENSLAPAMAVFAEGKRIGVSPKFVADQYQLWLRAINDASKIFVVGVRVHQIDTHICEVDPGNWTTGLDRVPPLNWR